MPSAQLTTGWREKKIFARKLILKGPSLHLCCCHQGCGSENGSSQPGQLLILSRVGSLLVKYILGGSGSGTKIHRSRIPGYNYLNVNVQ